MAFGIRCNFARIESYARAVKVWEKAVIFPKDPEGPRGLVDKRKKHLTIERTLFTEDIVLRLYAHPVVTWHKDNSVTICEYPTKSTGVFANHCTPEGMYVTASRSFRVTIDKRTYRVKNSITFRQRDDTWKADEITPWSVPVVNRERAKQALHETGYNEFRDWLRVYVQMSPRPDVGYQWLRHQEIVAMLRDRHRWRDLARLCSPNAWDYPDLTLRKIRQAVYSEYECVDRKSVPFLG